MHGRDTDAAGTGTGRVGQLQVKSSARTVDNGNIGWIQENCTAPTLGAAHVDGSQQPQVLATDLGKTALTRSVGSCCYTSQTDCTPCREQANVATVTRLRIGAEQTAGRQNGRLTRIQSNGATLARRAVGVNDTAVEQQAFGTVGQNLTVSSVLKTAGLNQSGVGDHLAEQLRHLAWLEQHRAAFAASLKLWVETVRHNKLNQSAPVDREGRLGGRSQVHLARLG